MDNKENCVDFNEIVIELVNSISIDTFHGLRNLWGNADSVSYDHWWFIQAMLFNLLLFFKEYCESKLKYEGWDFGALPVKVYEFAERLAALYNFIYTNLIEWNDDKAFTGIDIIDTLLVDDLVPSLFEYDDAELTLDQDSKRMEDLFRPYWLVKYIFGLVSTIHGQYMSGKEVTTGKNSANQRREQRAYPAGRYGVAMAAQDWAKDYIGHVEGLYNVKIAGKFDLLTNIQRLMVEPYIRENPDLFQGLKTSPRTQQLISKGTLNYDL